MSYADDLAFAFLESDLTVLVRFVRTGAVVRGFLDSGVEIVGADHLDVAESTTLLHVMHGALAGLVVDEQVQIGQLGAVSVTGADPFYKYRGPVTLQDDGALDHLALVEV